MTVKIFVHHTLFIFRIRTEAEEARQNSKDGDDDVSVSSTFNSSVVSAFNSAFSAHHCKSIDFNT